MLLYCISIIYPAPLIASKIIIILKKSNVNSLEIYWLSLKTLTLWKEPNPFTFQVDLVLVTTAVSVSDWNKYAAVQGSRGAEMLLLHFEYTLNFLMRKWCSQTVIHAEWNTVTVSFHCLIMSSAEVSSTPPKLHTVQVEHCFLLLNHALSKPLQTAPTPEVYLQPEPRLIWPVPVGCLWGTTD